jgi:hypothetical protein
MPKPPTTAVLPESARWQCPLCGAPVRQATLAEAPAGDRGLAFDCCGNLVTFDCLRDAFGIDLPGR